MSLRESLQPENFDEWFDGKEQFMWERHPPYGEQVRAIRNLAARGGEGSVIQIARFLRPWDIEEEGNWMGCEWVRSIAMEALCYVGRQDTSVRQTLEDISLSADPEWRNFNDRLIHNWFQLGDSPCLQHPYNDFLRSIKEVVDCIDQAAVSPDSF